MIFGTQPAFRAPGQPWQTFSGAPGGLKRPAGSKLREQNCGPIGNQGFQMLNFCFASRCSKSLRALVTVRPNPSKAWTPGSPETPLPAYDEQFVNFVVVFCPPFSISISRRWARNPFDKRAPLSHNMNTKFQVVVSLTLFLLLVSAGAAAEARPGMRHPPKNKTYLFDTLDYPGAASSIVFDINTTDKTAVGIFRTVVTVAY